MKRLLMILGGAAGACAIAIPAAAGLTANPSFSERVPIRVPSSAKVVTFDDQGVHTEPGDDNHRNRHGGSATSTVTPTRPGPRQ